MLQVGHVDRAVDDLQVGWVAYTVLGDRPADDVSNPQGRFVSSNAVREAQWGGDDFLGSELLQNVEVTGILTAAGLQRNGAAAVVCDEGKHGLQTLPAVPPVVCVELMMHDCYAGQRQTGDDLAQIQSASVVTSMPVDLSLTGKNHIEHGGANLIEVGVFAQCGSHNVGAGVSIRPRSTLVAPARDHSDDTTPTVPAWEPPV